MSLSSVIETWGTTEDERAAAYPGDELLAHPDRVLFRGVDVDTPASVVFRWLCQMRVAPYSYDWIDNRGRRSPRTLTPGVEELEIGQRVATIFRLVAFEPARSMTLDSTTAMFGRVVATYMAMPVGPDRSRLVVKIAFRAPGGAHGWLARRILPAGDLVMMRKQLLTLKDLAESSM